MGIYVCEGAEIRALLDQRSDLSPNERAALLQQAAQIDADNHQRGIQMVSERGQALTAEQEDIAAETIAVADGFEAVARVAGRPDIDPKEVLEAFDELDRRARALGMRVDSWGERAARHRGDAADPGAGVVALKRKWGEMSLANRGQFQTYIEGL